MIEKSYTIDFETYSESNLKKLGALAYSKHPTTRVLMLGFSDGTDIHVEESFVQQSYYSQLNKKMLKKYNNPKELEKLYKHIKSGGTIIAFNTLFEYYMWNNVYVKQFPKAPKLKYDQLLDARVMSVRLGAGGSLESSGMALLKEGKDVYGKVLMYKYCKPLTKKMIKEIETSSKPILTEEIEAFIKYCARDIELTNFIVKTFTDRYKSLYYTEEDKLVEQHTLKVNIEQVRIDVKLAKLLAYFYELLKKYNNKVVNKLTGGKIDSINQHEALLKFLKTECEYKKNSLGKEVIRGLRNYKNKLGNKILELRAGNNVTKLAKCAYIAERCGEGRISPEFVFHSTLTGRFVSRGSNMLNFARPATDKEYTNKLIKEITDYKPLDLVKKLKSASNIQDLGANLVRKVVIPEEGHKFLIADYSQVERRLLCLEADFKTAINKHKNGVCEYSQFASKYFNEDIVKGDPRRNFGKVAVLQGGYAGGAPAFKGEFEKFNIDISNSEIKNVVRLYRDMNKPIVTYWAKQQDKLMRALGQKKPLIIKTISGRELIYRDLQLRKTTGIYGDYTYVSYSTGIGYKKLHGGILTGHIIQSIARDLLIFHMAELIKLGYTITLPVHDEVVINIKNKKEETEIMKVLNKLPKWLDYHHNVEYSIADRYGK